MAGLPHAVNACGRGQKSVKNCTLIITSPTGNTGCGVHIE
jgi:hypothetical protein